LDTEALPRFKIGVSCVMVPKALPGQDTVAP
jgi:hypothetical protein